MKNSIALVTGAARGIGAAIAQTLARDGFDLALVDLKEAELVSVQTEIKNLGRRAEIFGCNVADYGATQRTLEAVKSKLGPVSVLVNNAGILKDGMLHKMTEESWDQVIAVNLKGVFNMTQAAAKQMTELKRGRIINLSSIAWMGNVGQTNYSASKAGVVGLTYTWALELSRYGITCNAIAPGFIDTQMTQSVPEDIKSAFIQRIPLKRMGLPQDIAETVAFLASERASYITGQVIQVDGGITTGLA